MADGATPPRPTAPSERIDAIDVLRGLALLGVVAINVVTLFRVSFFEQFLFLKPPLSFSSIDSAIETILTLAVELKALALFSLLFGAGLAIQFERLARSERRALLLVRRLVVLLAFGLIHLCLIWNGDILTIGLFLLGAFAWRTGILRNPPRHLIFSIAAVCIGLGAALILAHAGRLIASGRIDALAEPLGIIVLALGYGAGIIGIASLDSGKRLLGWAAPLGRMAFTNYLAQSVILGWIFYGYGLGLFGKLGVTSALAIALAVYFVQVPFSAWWLRRYRYGPVEWLWRTLMYGAAQPMRSSSTPKPASA